jgi:hypothetical protein
MSKLNFILFFAFISLINSLLVDIKDDFDLNIQYRLEKQETNWLKRGQLIFRTKDKDTYKSTASLNDFSITPQMKKEITKECKLKGNYILQLINPKNNTQRYYTSVNPCDLASSNFHDKLLINAFAPIENNKIISFRYIADEDFEDDFSEDDFEDDEEIVRNNKKKKRIFTKIELNQVKKVEGPFFSEDDDGADETIKKKKEEEKPKSFLSRYWYLIAIFMLMMMMNGGQEPQPGQGQGQGQGQQAGTTSGEAK